MIIKIDKQINKLKIALIGERSNILAEVLDELNFNYSQIQKHIDDDYDVLFGSGVYNILPDKDISKIKYGAFFFHETPLPEGRGSAPIQWTILNKRKNLTITLMKIDSGIDTGEIAYQYNVGIDVLDTYNDIENKRILGIRNCFIEFMKEFSSGYIVLRKQSGYGSYTKKRTPLDSKLNPKKPLLELWDNIRMCDNNKFPAFFELNGAKVYLKYEVKKDNK